MELQLNLDFDEPATSGPAKRARLTRDQVRRKNAGKRKEQKTNYDKWKKINAKKAVTREKGQNAALNEKEQETSEKVERKRKIDAQRQARVDGRVAKKPKTAEAEKNSDYVRPEFDGDWSFGTLEALTRNMFDDHVEIPELPQQRQVQREELFKPEATFEELKLHSYLNGNMKVIFGHERPTRVQLTAIPAILNGDDTLIRSQTGSGKTLAYMLPIFDRLMRREPPVTRTSGVAAIIILPTRELVLQSYEAAVKLTRAATNIVACALTGGESRKSEKARLRKGVNIVLGTPGRLIDHLEKSESMKEMIGLDMLVFDEADRMLEMGYLGKIKHIIMLVKERNKDAKLQNVLLSATLGESVESLAGLALNDPKRIVVKDTDDDETETFAVPDTLETCVSVIPSKLRFVALIANLSKRPKSLVFVNTMAEVNFLHETLSNMEMPNGSMLNPLTFYRLHGDMEQAERVANMTKFRADDKAVLIATDVASRGLDLPSVGHIIQYSAPGSAREYIQRIGRTARKGQSGLATLFLLPTEIGFLSAVAAIGAGEWEQIEMDTLIRDGFSRNGQKNSIQQTREAAAAYQNKLELFVKDNQELKKLAIEAYCSFIRSYSAYPSELKTIFHIKKLHLGHLAKSFGIREKPSDFLSSRADLSWAVRREDAGAYVDQDAKKKQMARKEKRRMEVNKKINDLVISEFDAGI